ncbi:MAG: PEP-utilizing enzyme [Candidatus Paceibacterota bacterium]|jgi:phosphoenolpyruvate synthase/pyruvate phosphate dikinase
MEKEKSLADKFIEETGGQELFPPLHNSSLIVQASDWATKKYYGKLYDDKTPFPILINSKEGEGVMYIPLTKVKKLAEEIFKKFWSDNSELDRRLQYYNGQTKIVDELYDELTYGYISSASFEDLSAKLLRLQETVWRMNSSVFFSIYFDEEMCQKFLDLVGYHIDKERFKIIWTRASVPSINSFEKRRLLFILDFLKNGKSFENIAEKCQYFEAAYHKIASLPETIDLLSSKYGDYKNPAVAIGQYDKEMGESKKVSGDYSNWLSTLTKEEKLIAQYIQFVISIRDDRKDYLAKYIAATYRVAERMFAECAVPKDLIYHYTFDELLLGPGNLISVKETLADRKRGYSILVHYDGTMEHESGVFEETKTTMDKYFLGQQIVQEQKEIKGQVGSPGIIRGIVKIVRNIEKESYKLKDGNILVTGMTRPEFVPLMKIAGGIITDEGGITCHAAIISRELKIPCIIGTKIATRILKDDMEVEIDANKGIVHIIS